MYGDVTLQEDLEIGEDESLAIGDGASLNTGSHEVIVNGGTLTGGDNITGTVKYAPAITTESLPSGTVGTAYSQTLAATGSDTITWSLASGSLPAGLGINESTGEITGTPTAEGSSTFTVKAENSYGSDSRAYTLTIDTKQEVSVTGVSLSATSLILTEEETAVLTATVEPANATNQKVTWSSSAPGVATVDANGKVTAVDVGTAVITVTTEDGDKTATCTVTVEHDPAGAWSSDADGHWHACASCGDKLDYAGHSWGAWVATEPATCTDDGLEARTCAACGRTQTRTVPALGHAWGEPAWRWSDDGEEFVASFACENDPSHTLELTAAPTSEVASEPTCIEPGTTRYYAEVELDGVTYAAEATAADIPARGHKFEDGVCTVCGAKDEGYVAPQRPDPRPEPEPVETDPELPTTGDATAVGLLGALACGGAALAIGAALRMRSR